MTVQGQADEGKGQIHQQTAHRGRGQGFSAEQVLSSPL